MTNLKPYSYSHVLTILIGFIKIALIFIVFAAARNNNDIIIYAILIFIYTEVQENRIHSLWGTNSMIRNIIEIVNKTRPSSAFEQESSREDLHGIISYVFVGIMKLICLYHFVIAIFNILKA